MFELNVCVTAQHRQMLDQVLGVFNIKPDVDLNLMTPDQSLVNLTANAIKMIDSYFSKFNPDMLFIQGDTTTALAASIVAYYHRIKIAHIEAGLRTYEKFAPFPEEINRVAHKPSCRYSFCTNKNCRTELIERGYYTG